VKKKIYVCGIIDLLAYLQQNTPEKPILLMMLPAGDSY